MEYQKDIFRFLYRKTNNRELAEDLTQDVMIKVLEKSYQVRDPSKFKSWVFAVASNAFKNHCRKNPRFKTQEFDSGCVFDPDLLIWYRQSIKKLSDRQRTAFELRVVYGLPFKDVAEIMNTHYETAKAHYRHAMIKLRSIYDADACKCVNGL